MKTTTMIPLGTRSTNPNTNDNDATDANKNKIIDDEHHHQPTQKNDNTKNFNEEKETRPQQQQEEEEPVSLITNESSTVESLSSSSSSAKPSTSTSTTTMTTTTKTTTMNNSNNNSNSINNTNINTIVRDGVIKEIQKYVLRSKLSKLRHLVIKKGINPLYLNSIFEKMQNNFHPQTVHYNGGIAQIKEWKISCYLEVMEGGVPCTNPNLTLLKLFQPLLDTCNELFLEWYRQQHSCNKKLEGKITRSCKRIMTFITRYTPAPGEQALLKHVDGAGKVDGSCVVALPEQKGDNSFIGYGGGITFWDGINGDKSSTTSKTREIHYETRSGDIAFIDRAVWHQADPITKGTRWALVIFYDVQTKLL